MFHNHLAVTFAEAKTRAPSKTVVICQVPKKLAKVTTVFEKWCTAREVQLIYAAVPAPINIW